MNLNLPQHLLQIPYFPDFQLTKIVGEMSGSTIYEWHCLIRLLHRNKWYVIEHKQSYAVDPKNKESEEMLVNKIMPKLYKQAYMLTQSFKLNNLPEYYLDPCEYTEANRLAKNITNPLQACLNRWPGSVKDR